MAPVTVAVPAGASSAVYTQSRARIVVVGAGFGGLWAARALARHLKESDAEILLLDRNNYHTFFPLLYQVAAAELAPSDIAYPVRSILRKTRVRFRMAEVRGIDLAQRTVDIGTEQIPYDRLVLALGSVSHDFGVPGAREHAFFLRWMDDAIPLRQHVLARFEAASAERDDERRRRLLTFVIVGGGPTGVEFAGALAEFVWGPARRDYATIGPDEPRIVLVEAIDRVLGSMPAHLSAFARDRLKLRRVEVRTGATVERITATDVRLKGGELIPTETVVWTAGVKADPRVAEWGLPTAKSGRVPVTPALHLADHPEVYVVGDLALLEEDGALLPQVAQVAMQEGTAAAENIARSLRSLRPRPFHYKNLGVLAVIGRNAAVADLNGKTFSGFPAWVLWLGIHIAWLIGFRNRLLVLVNWAWNYLFPRRSVRLILPERVTRPPAAE
jgi:NADH dehydrogenase